MAIHISDPETVELVRRLAKLSGGVTEAVRQAVIAELKARNESATTEKPKLRSLRDEFFALIKEHFDEYARLKRADGGRASGRAYAQLYRYRDEKDPVGYARAILKNANRDGLKFLAQRNQLELSFEQDILRSEFSNLFPDEIKAQARANLAWAEQHEA